MTFSALLSLSFSSYRLDMVVENFSDSGKSHYAFSTANLVPFYNVFSSWVREPVKVAVFVSKFLSPLFKH